MIQSSVLGTALTKLKVNGAKDITYVPANGLVFPMQMQDQPNSNPASYLSWVSRDPLGIQENKDGYLYAYDTFGNPISNVQPPSGGPPPYMPVYGATYGGVTWNAFINANNFSGGCYSAQNNNATICNGALQEQMSRMGPAFWANQPGAPPDPYAQARYEFNMNNSIYGSSSGQSGSAPDSFDVFYGDIYTSSVTIYAGAALVQTNLPQNPVVPLTPSQTRAISDQIAWLLTDKCAKFINQIISSQTGKPYDSKKSLLTDFNSIRDGKGGFFFGGTSYGGDASGSLASGNGTVRIANWYSFTDPKKAFGASFVALHEIIHIIAGAGDQTLSERVRDLGIKVMAYPGYTSPYPTDSDNRNLAFSGYWGQALKNACDPKGY